MCNGTLDGVVRMCRVLRSAGHTHVAVEDPGWSRLSSAVSAVGLTPVPVAVDRDGLRIDRLRASSRTRAVVVAPAHQFPTGTVLSPARRAELLDWARRSTGWCWKTTTTPSSATTAVLSAPFRVWTAPGWRSWGR
ncbi:aminotransferase class I/II-fold pyridoxal phosphate-dependent enzyme [Streptomyces sp. INA 01156]